MLRESTAALGNVSVATFDGLDGRVRAQAGRLGGAARHPRHQRLRIRVQMALMNRRLAPEIETVSCNPPAATRLSAREC